MAGLITASMGLTFIVGPTLATVLYGLLPELPVIAGAVWMLARCLFVLIHPSFRRAQPPSV